MVLKTGLKLPQAPFFPIFSSWFWASLVLKLWAVSEQEGDDEVDPIGRKNLDALNKYKQLDFMPFDPRQKRTEGKLQDENGNIFRITKVIQGLHGLVWRNKRI